MKILNAVSVACAVFVGTATIAPAATTIVNFDSLSPSILVPNAYGGITWGPDWTTYGSPTPPYAFKSPLNVVRTTSFVNSGSFSFSQPVVFVGAWFSGFVNNPVTFTFFLNTLPAGTAVTLPAPGAVPAFLSSGYAGLVDQVTVTALNSEFVMDDVTYTAPVPVPATVLMLLTGLGGLAAVRRARKG